jgi:transposase
MPEMDNEKTKLVWLAKRLGDVAEEINLLDDDQKKMVVERADKKEGWNLKALYEILDEYMGW